ncbi:hypothetical protein KKG58_00955 [Patescibacteria group bacterium]|nr:hypothetical protein [Patescibacteria group bacterium]
MFEENQKQSSQQPQEPTTQGSSPIPPTEPEAAQSVVPAPKPQPEAGPPLAEAPESTVAPPAPVPAPTPEPAAELPQQEPVATTPQPEAGLRQRTDTVPQDEEAGPLLADAPESTLAPPAPVPAPTPEPAAELPQQEPVAATPQPETGLPLAEMPEQTSPPPLPQQSATKFATPELAKKEIIQEADEGGDSEEETIRVMADKFRKSKPKRLGRGKKKSNFLIILLVVVVLIIAGGLGFYFWAQKYSQETVTPEPLTEPTDTEIEPIEPIEEEELETEIIEEEVMSEEQTLKKELKNDNDELVSWIEIYLPEGAIETDIKLEISGELAGEESEGDYKIIGGLYQVSSQKIENEPVNPDVEIKEETDDEIEETLDIIFKKTANLKMFYHQDLIEDAWEKDLVLGYFKDDIWTPLSSSLDEETNTLTISLDFIPAKTLAIIVAKEKLTPKVEMFQIAPEVQSSADTDSDGLTDIEETLYHTEVNNPDSDTDTTPDGQEILNLTDPNQQVEGAQLAASGLINVYTNPTYSYSFFYPSSWLARAIPETNNQEVLVITNTGEFFSITVENNPEGLKPVEWYLRQSPSVDQSLLYSTIVNNQEAVWNPEHLTLYISKNSRIYILSYNVGTEKEANFKTSFELMINSFRFVVQPQGRADGTLIKYPDQPGVYLIESGKKRAFTSGEVFERIGFKWEDVIEIPYNETYIDGDPVAGRLDGILIKYVDQPGVYLIEYAKKRAFASGEVFEALGFKWDDVIEILADEVYPDGPIIDSNIEIPNP